MWLANHVSVNKSQPQARVDTLPAQRYTPHTVSIQTLISSGEQIQQFKSENQRVTGVAGSSSACQLSLPLPHHLSSPPAEPSLLWWSWLLCLMPARQQKGMNLWWFVCLQLKPERNTCTVLNDEYCCFMQRWKKKKSCSQTGEQYNKIRPIIKVCLRHPTDWIQCLLPAYVEKSG